MRTPEAASGGEKGSLGVAETPHKQRWAPQGKSPESPHLRCKEFWSAPHPEKGRNKTWDRKIGGRFADAVLDSICPTPHLSIVGFNWKFKNGAPTEHLKWAMNSGIPSRRRFQSTHRRMPKESFDFLSPKSSRLKSHRFAQLPSANTKKEKKQKKKKKKSAGRDEWRTWESRFSRIHISKRHKPRKEGRTRERRQRRAASHLLFQAYPKDLHCKLHRGTLEKNQGRRNGTFRKTHRWRGN